MAKTKVITFFSYKGGAGRSTLAYNIIPLIADKDHLNATKEHPIIILDMDIDSCGMSYLLDVIDQITADNNVQSFLDNKGCDSVITASISDHPTFKNLCKVGKKFGLDDDEAVLFMPAKDVTNVDHNGSPNYSDAGNPFKKYLSSLKETCQVYGVPAVIFDCAVGNNATANAANQVADIVLCCLRPTTQFVNGTVRFLKTLDTDSESPWVGGRKKIIIVPNVVPTENVVIDDQRYPARAIQNMINRFDDLLRGKDEYDDITYDTTLIDEEEFGIPAVKSFMWREGQLCTQKELSSDEETALKRYRKLTDIVCKYCK